MCVSKRERERERERERCRACLDLGLSGRVREKEKGREDRMVSIGVLEIWKWPLELGKRNFDRYIGEGWTCFESQSKECEKEH